MDRTTLTNYIYSLHKYTTNPNPKLTFSIPNGVITGEVLYVRNYKNMKPNPTKQPILLSKLISRGIFNKCKDNDFIYKSEDDDEFILLQNVKEETGTQLSNSELSILFLKDIIMVNHAHFT